MEKSIEEMMKERKEDKERIKELQAGSWKAKDPQQDRKHPQQKRSKEEAAKEKKPNRSSRQQEEDDPQLRRPGPKKPEDFVKGQPKDYKAKKELVCSLQLRRNQLPVEVERRDQVLVLVRRRRKRLEEREQRPQRKREV